VSGGSFLRHRLLEGCCWVRLGIHNESGYFWIAIENIGIIETIETIVIIKKIKATREQ
jgi:hypothetical protein